VHSALTAHHEWAHAHSLAHRAPHIARNAVSAVHRLAQLLGLDLHSFRRAMCGPPTLPGDRHLPAWGYWSETASSLDFEGAILLNLVEADGGVFSSATFESDSKVRYITSLKHGDMGIRGKIHPEDTL
jgi:hypothetical protein